MKINLVQLSIFLGLAGLLRIPSIAAWVTSSLRCFAYHSMTNYERLSALDWAVHYSVLGYNIGILLSLFKTTPNQVAAKKKRAYAIVTAGFGHILGHGDRWIITAANNVGHPLLVVSWRLYPQG
eukprot:11508934-Ditylum_brightwellii.AAC.1